MANFDIAFQRTIFHEGGYVNDPNDAGGETYMGISRRAHPKSRIWKIIDEDKRTNGIIGINKRLKANNWLTACIKDIYKEEYWDRFELDSVRVQKIANEIFDDCVNRGCSAAAIAISASLGMTPTNKITEALLYNLKHL